MKLIKSSSLVLLVSFQLSACASKSVITDATTDYQKGCRALAARKFSSPEEKLNAVFKFEWDSLMKTYPEWATYNGLEIGQDRLTDMSLEAIRSRESDLPCTLAMIDSVPRSELKNPKDQLNYDLFRRKAAEAIEETKFPGELLVIDQMGGVHQSLPQLFQAMRKEKMKDYQNILARLEKSPILIRQHRALLEEGLKKGITPPRVTLKPVPLQIAPLLVTDLSKNPLYEVFREMPKTISADDQKRIRDRASDLITKSVIPALGEFRRFIETTYIPNARETLSFTSLPDGQAWYVSVVKDHTTTNLTPQEIHQLGLKETERIRGEMIKVMKASGWKKDLTSFFHFLRTDRRFFFKSREELLASYRDIAKRIDPELSKLFGKLPRLTYGVRAVPDYAEAAAPTAYYEGGNQAAGRPGWFIANTYDLKSRPKWEMEPLTAHEAVPGHHLQIALAGEMENVPDFRRDDSYTAYVEGWGLYAESLGTEVGLYKEPYSKMGQLTYEMWRANRLVVDTGLHALGWTREKAIEFMKSNMPKPDHDIRVEVDRYVVMPGQALAYKIGQLKFLELREKARSELGDKFNIRAFHDKVLEDGALPLDVLETKINGWISDQKRL